MATKIVITPSKREETGDPMAILRLALSNVFCDSLKISKTMFTSEAAIEYFLSYMFFHYTKDDETLETRAREWMVKTLRPALVKGREKLLVDLYMTPITTLYIEDWELLIKALFHIMEQTTMDLTKLTTLEAKDQYDMFSNVVDETNPGKKITQGEKLLSLMTLYLHAMDGTDSILWTNYWIHLVGYVHRSIEKLNKDIKKKHPFLAEEILLSVMDMLRSL